MARCGCASGSCSCLVTGAGGITVTGAGSQDNPFVVHGPYLSVGNSPTADLVLTGSGTQGDPYRIVCNVHMVLDQLTDVDAPSPVAGYVLTYVTSPSPAWKAAIPQSGTPGAVLHDITLKGDGTAGSVLGVLLDPAGGITSGPSGLKAPTGWTICTSGTRPGAPAAYDRIIESDTQAWGFWMPGSPGKWRMYDTKPQLWTPHLTSGYFPGVSLGSGGAAKGTYMRQGAQTAVNFSFHIGEGGNLGYGEFRVDNPPVPIGAAAAMDSMYGSGFLHASGWAYWQALVEANSSCQCIRWWTANPGNANIWLAQSSDSSNRPGTGVPNRPGTWPFQGNSDLKGSVTYFNE
jgi:hypothetical protein